MSISSSSNRPPDWGNPIHLLAFGLGSGGVTGAPGTVGTIAAIPLYLLLRPLPAGYYLLLVAVLFVVGVWLCGRTARDLDTPDHGGIVWDEWIGLLVSSWLCPEGWGWLLLGVVLFRFFDIVKPWPIGWLDRKLTGGIGIMIDDLVAGLMSFVVLQLVARLL